jgi:RHS repeat-associated protein
MRLLQFSSKLVFSPLFTSQRCTLLFRGRKTGALLLAVWCLLLGAMTTSAQNVQYTNNTVDSSLRSDARVDPSTFGLGFQITLRNYPGRGGNNLPLTLYYSSKAWRIKHLTSFNQDGCVSLLMAKYAEHSAAGWTTSLDLPSVEWPEADEVYSSIGRGITTQCQATPVYKLKRVLIHMPDGSTHELRKDDVPYQGTPETTGTFYAVDGSRMRYVAPDPDNTQLPDGTTASGVLFLPNGTRYFLGNGAAALSIDSDGNTLKYQVVGGVGQWTDTLGRTTNSLSINAYASQYPAPNPYAMRGVGGQADNYNFVWKPLGQVLTNPNDAPMYVGAYYADQEIPTNLSQTHAIQEAHPEVMGFLFNTDDMLVGPNDKFNQGVLHQIVLPNGSAYTFTYNKYGEIDKIVYPTGAYERFEYQQMPALGSTSGDYNVTNRGVKYRWVSVKGDGSDEAVNKWEYQVNPSSSIERSVIAPDQTKTTQYLYINPPYSQSNTGQYLPFGFEDARSGMDKESRVYSDSGQLLRRTIRVWEKSQAQLPSTFKDYHNNYIYAQRNPRVSKEIEILLPETGTGTALAKVVTYEYDTTHQFDVGLDQTAVSEYDYVTVDLSIAQSHTYDQIISGDEIQTGALLRRTQTSYLTNDPINGANYLARNILGLPTSTVILDASGTHVAKTQIAYDGTAVIPENGSTGWTDPGTTLGTWRGNATKISRFLDPNADNCQTPGTCVETSTQYDKYGNVRSTTDALGHISQVGYSATYAYAYPTSATSPVPDPDGQTGTNMPLATTTAYDPDTGLVNSTTDANNQTTYLEYSDSLDRLTKVTRPDGGQTTFEYGDATDNINIHSRTQLDNSRWIDTYQYFDGAGRPSRNSRSEGATSIEAETVYNSLGQVWKVSNPYRAGETKRWTLSEYDPLGRVTKVTTADGAHVDTTYRVNSVTVTDQALRKRSSVTDALGRLKSVTEDPNGLNYQTAYTYDVLGNLLTVQQGVQTRTFVYDSLSRLTSATNPEACNQQGAQCTPVATTYRYDGNGNLTQKIDPRAVTTTSEYDRLNRITKRSYSDGTPTVNYTYDTAGVMNSKGRLTKVSSAVSANYYTAFDAMGRVTASSQVTDLQPYSMSYEYNLAGNLKSEVYPSGRVVQNTYDEAGRINGVTGYKGAIVTPYAAQFTYTAHGAVAALKLGNGLWEHTVFNARLQPQLIGLGTYPTLDSGAQALDRFRIDYDYGGTANNGNVMQQTISLPPYTDGHYTLSMTQSYAYDQLNRLISASESGGANPWTQTYLYDDTAPNQQGGRYGNRRIDTAQTTANVQPVNNPTFDLTSNRIATGQGYGYDRAGNVTSDPAYIYTYDAENRMATSLDTEARTTSYAYDGDGRRVKKVAPSGITVFVYNAMGQMVAEYADTNLPVAGQTSYLTDDALGTPRVITDANGGVMARHDYLPFGEEISVGVGGRTGNPNNQVDKGYVNDNVKQKFTQKERDLETGLDYFGARYYGSMMGRFMSTDPIVVTPERFYDPQQFNQYAYVRNNPLRFVDPTGKILTISGDLDEAITQLRDMLGVEDANKRISFDAKTNTITVDLAGIDLSQNEGASALNDVVSSTKHYDLSIGSKVQSLGGTEKTGLLNTNLTLNDERFKGKNDKFKPPKGVDAQIGVDVDAVRRNRKSNTDLKTALPYTVVFHELAEAYAKLEHNKQYNPAHQEAVEREQKLRDQRPYLKDYNPGSGPGDDIYDKPIIKK